MNSSATSCSIVTSSALTWGAGSLASFAAPFSAGGRSSRRVKWLASRGGSSSLRCGGLPRVRDCLLIYLNGQPLEIRGGDAFLPLSEFLRRRRRLVGTK